ncbi:Vacuolar protein sorting-associated protein 51 homolog [Linum grandiflorum]
MAMEDVPLDDKAKRMRDLLSSFYAPADPSMSTDSIPKGASLDAINTTSFDADQYMNLLVQRSNLEGLLQRHVEMAAEIKNLDTDLQMLVYENYNKFISATDAIKRMKSNIVGMEVNMEQLLSKIMSVQSRSDGVNTSLFEKREHIEKLHRTRNLLRKVQFIYDLPARLGKCIKTEAYADAVRFYTGAMPILKAYGESSFLDCKRASEEAVATITKNLQGKLFSDSESIKTRAEAAVLLKQLAFPVDGLKAKLFEKLEQSLEDVQLNYGNISATLKESNEHENYLQMPFAVAHDASVRGFVEAVSAYRVIFPDSESQLIKLAEQLISMHFLTTEEYTKERVSTPTFLCVLRMIWGDVLLVDEVLPEALLHDYCYKVSQSAIKQYVSSTFSHLLHDVSDALTNVHVNQKEALEENPLQVAMEAGKNSLLKGSMDVLLGFRQLLDDNLDLLVKQRELMIDWIQECFQQFFESLDSQFILLSGRNNSIPQEHSPREGLQAEKVLSGLVLVLAQLSVFIEQTAIPRIAEASNEIAASFSGGGARRYEHGPVFLPAELSRVFRSSSEKFLHHHKEPREVHMFVDLFLQELEGVGTEVKQILSQGVRKHRRSESNGSTTSSLSNSLRDDKLRRSSTQRARSQLLETHLAKLFKQKVEIFTKVEFTQESVLTTIVKLGLKSLQEFVRLQTLNRSGFQQIQLDIQFLRTPLKELSEDEAALDFLLDEVIVGASDRCLDPTPLEPPILDKLIQAKMAGSKDRNPSSS